MADAAAQLGAPHSVAQPRLADSLKILDGFVLRNKNQHRHSVWWAELGILRRCLRRLSVELDEWQRWQRDIAAAAPFLSSSSNSKAKKKKQQQQNKEGKGKDAGRRADAVDEKVEARVRWAREICFPNSYFAFTQLAADSQFAHLGLLLLGVLADVDAAISPLLPESDPVGRDEQGLTAASEVAEVGCVLPVSADAAGEPARPPTLGQPEIDIGVAVARQEQGSSPPTTTRKAEKRKQAGDGDQDVREDDGERREGEKSRKKKKRAKGGDEFYDLFSSLL